MQIPILKKMQNSFLKQTNNFFFKNIFRFSQRIPSWATVDPYKLSSSDPYKVQNLVSGKWKDSQNYVDIVDPKNDGVFLKVPDTKGSEL